MTDELHAIYFDDYQKHLDGYRPIWEAVLKKISSRVRLECLPNIDASVVRERRPHIVIVDNVVRTKSDEEIDNEGAKFISELKAELPHILFILFTQESFSVRTLAQLYPNPDIIIPKPNFRSTEYQEKWIIPKIKRELSRRPAGAVHPEPVQLRRELMDRIRDIDCIIEQSLNKILSYEPDAVDQINIKKLTGGASGAYVFLATITGLQRLQNVPIVFRLAGADDIEAEINNYMRFVALQVPHNLKVELIGSGRSGAFGGAMYAFALGDTIHTKTAYDLIHESPLAASRIFSSICSYIFNSEQIGWYIYDESSTIDIVGYFSNSKEYGPSKDNRRVNGIRKNIINYAMKNCSINGDNMRIGVSDLALPRNLLDKFDGIKLNTCICHGDLNLKNIIISGDANKMALIDFEYSGFDHIFKDYISLDVSLLDIEEYGNTVEEVYEKQLWDLSEQMFWGDSGRLRYEIAKTIVGRFPNTYRSYYNSYMICLAFHLFKVAALKSVKERHFKNMFATLCAIVKILEERPEVD